MDLKPEAPLIDENHRPPPTWPERGAIEFDRFSMRYRPNLDLVLRDVSFRVEPEEKIGICGRTGACPVSFVGDMANLKRSIQARESPASPWWVVKFIWRCMAVRRLNWPWSGDRLCFVLLKGRVGVS
jgi:hypothetical protein